jgi:hypothetical protein
LCSLDSYFDISFFLLIWDIFYIFHGAAAEVQEKFIHMWEKFRAGLLCSTTVLKCRDY